MVGSRLGQMEVPRLDRGEHIAPLVGAGADERCGLDDPPLDPLRLRLRRRHFPLRKRKLAKGVIS